MSKLYRKWAVLAAMLGGLMFQFGGCMGGWSKYFIAYLNEDIFG